MKAPTIGGLIGFILVVIACGAVMAFVFRNPEPQPAPEPQTLVVERPAADPDRWTGNYPRANITAAGGLHVYELGKRIAGYAPGAWTSFRIEE